MKLMLSNKKNSILTVAVLLTQSFSSSRAFVCDLSPLAHTENKVFVINTCSQGIGHQFTKQLLRRSSPSTRVIGLHRSLTDSLSSLHSEYNDRLSLVSIDIESQASIDEAKLKIQSLTNHVDILINAAGILGDGKTTPGPERSATQIDRSWLEKTMQVNLIGHVMVTQALLPLMQRGSNSEFKYPSKVINISARVGSIDDNKLGGWYSYRMSKAALNMFTKTCAIEMKRHNCAIISLHPGTTDTQLSVPFQKNVIPGKLFPVEYSVNKMLEVIWSTDMTTSGKFLAYDGTEIPF